MNTTGTPFGTRSERVAERVPNESLARVSHSTEVLTSPKYGTRVEAREERSTAEAIRHVSYADGLTAIVCHLRPDWHHAEVRRQILRDPRPDAIAAPAAIFAALDPTIRHPGAIGTYRPPTQRDERRAPEVRAPRCPHGTLADPDGRGADCAGCGTEVRPPAPDLLAGLRRAASGPTRHVPAPDAATARTEARP